MKHSKFFSLVFVFYLFSIASDSLSVYKFDPRFAQNTFANSRYINDAFFVPDDKVKKLLLSLIDNERSSILFAQFRITDGDLAQALCQARERGVVIRCITDDSCVDDKYNKLALLRNKRIPIAVYERSGIMHNKFFIFGNNVARKPLLWTGSANASRAGTTRNQENVIVTESKRLIRTYREKFRALWHEIKNKGKKESPVTHKQVLILLRCLE